MNLNTYKTPFKLIILAGVALLLLYGLFHFFAREELPSLPSPKVVIQHPKTINLTEYVTQTGTVVAYNSVDLVARVEGYLQAIDFTDGTIVKKDQPLFVIEPKPYFEQLTAAKALVKVKKADLAYTKAEYERQQRMYKQNATSLNNVEKWYAKLEETKASIEKATADEANAAITYSYTHVYAPFDGRIGRHMVDVGNLVGHGEATNLATIEQLHPIYVYFNLNELDLIKIREAARAMDFKPSDINTILVDIGMQNEPGYPHRGHLDFVNTGLNASTGTMEFRAVLSNKNFVLLPGLFVRVRIPISKPKPELAIPVEAIQYDQSGPYALVVNKKSLVEIKRIKTGAVKNGLRAVVEGLDASDSVVVSGLQNAIPGSHVVPTDKESATE